MRHLVRDFERFPDLNKRSAVDAGTVSAGIRPIRAVINKLRPERKCAALRRLRGVDAAAARHEKRALRFARFAEAYLVLSSIYVLSFELRDGKAQKLGRTHDVGFAQKDVAFLIAAGNAPGFALEAEGAHASILVAGYRIGNRRRYRTA